MIHQRHFFSNYLVDHYLYKTATLKNIIDQYDELKPSVLKGITDIEDDKYLDSLRAEIRATYYQAIETLFELVFALSPKDGVVENQNIWYHLSTSDWRENLKRIDEIAEGDTDFLSQTIVAGQDEEGNDIEVPLGQYIFYFGVTNPDVADHIPGSLAAIEDALVMFAQEFSDRDEYNALKHSLRIFHTFERLHVRPSDEEDAEWHKLLDMQGSMSYLKEEEGGISIHAVPMDTERDVAMTHLCSSLISNIIGTRRVHFVEEAGSKMHLAMLDKDVLNEISKQNKQMLKFRFHIEPVYADDETGEERD